MSVGSTTIAPGGRNVPDLARQAEVIGDDQALEAVEAVEAVLGPALEGFGRDPLAEV